MMPIDPFSGGTVLRRPALQSPNYSAGAAGWIISADGSAEFNNLTIRGTFAGTDFEVNSLGAFFYSGTPALGNLVNSITPASVLSGTDRFGNTYYGGNVSYTPNGSGGATTAVAMQNGSVLLGPPANFYSPFPTPGLVGIAAGSQTWQSGGTAAGDSPAFIDLLSGNANSTPGSPQTNINGNVDIQGAGLVRVTAPGVEAFAPGSTTTTESWHDMRPLSGSFVGTITGQYPPQYRLAADGFVEVFGYVQAAGTGNPNGVTFATLPAAYRPGSHVISWPVTMDQEPSATTAFTPRCEVATTGALSIHQAPTAYTTTPVFNIKGRFPLNNTGLITS